jgi:hypothetical protein
MSLAAAKTESWAQGRIPVLDIGAYLAGEAGAAAPLVPLPPLPLFPGPLPALLRGSLYAHLVPPVQGCSQAR